jgi:hypothetical protein
MNARWIAAALVAAGCINEDRRLYEVTLAGTITVAGGATGEVHLELHHARRGAGDLETPLGLIEETTSDAAGAIEWTALVPIDEGEGLVVYGWLDIDGDGLLCGLGGAPEPAGVIEIAGFPAHALSFALVLDTPCAGPTALYPP